MQLVWSEFNDILGEWRYTQWVLPKQNVIAFFEKLEVKISSILIKSLQLREMAACG